MQAPSKYYFEDAYMKKVLLAKCLKNYVIIKSIYKINITWYNLNV